MSGKVRPLVVLVVHEQQAGQLDAIVVHLMKTASFTTAFVVAMDYIGVPTCHAL